jgi:hypothetical protein
MLDRALCSTMTLGQDPIVDIEALTELCDVLNRTLRNRRSDVLEDGHRHDTQGGADAQAIPQSRATGAVSSPFEDP